MARGTFTMVAFGSFMLLGAVGCSDNGAVKADSRVADAKVTGDAAPAADAGPAKEAGAADGPSQPITFTARIEGFGMAGATVPGVTVELYDNDTGKGTGTKQTSNADGKVTFAGLLKGKLYGFKATLANYKDTFCWNVKAETTEERLWVVPNSVFQIALGLAGLAAQPGKSVVAGAIYWVDGKGTEEGVGCAKVASTPATPDVRYMKAASGMPAPLSEQACTANNGTQGNGRFVAVNLAPGQVTIAATDSTGAEIGSTKFWSVADAIAVGNIYAKPSITKNPTPASCGCTP
ncbi:MAG: carboxypeptidase regulatory-like domain-containing protein [Deltaproteobacteria bacterium]|nr:carboxypeptidase regulatory-like domain-containing protein [Deltaproteobacteria bacterium]